eukprot:GEMP01027610.1.p1 GENE.GEMP01027610.1~~GEMP01027610.1.p1  ORF type:complete len:584 (+),score=130.43 GEMP01027610.1:225-1976(+)
MARSASPPPYRRNRRGSASRSPSRHGPLRSRSRGAVSRERRQRSPSFRFRRQRSPSNWRGRSSSYKRGRSRASARRQRSPSRRRSRSRSPPRRDSRSRSPGARRFSRRGRSRSRSFRGRGLRSSRSASRGRGMFNRASSVNKIPLGRRDDSRSRARTMSPDRIRLWLPNNDCARIIGKNGNQLKEIEDDTKASLRVQREAEMKRLGVTERYVDIRGKSLARTKAKDRIISLADFVKDSEGFVLKGDDDIAPATILKILREEVGRILGRRGEQIRDIEHDTRTRIDVDRRTGKIRISGNSEQRKAAMDVIMAEVSFCEDEDGNVLKEPGKEGEEDCLKMYILDKEAGRVIGRGGETVREIMEKSDAQVKVQKNEKNDAISNERLIQIFGEEEDRQRAMELILEEVSFAKDSYGNIVKNTGNHEIDPGLAHIRQLSKGAWICGFCSGNHQTKKCPSREMNAQAMMQMQILAGVAPMIPGMHAMPAMVPIAPPVAVPTLPAAIPPAPPIQTIDQSEVDAVNAALEEYEREDEDEEDERDNRNEDEYTNEKQYRKVNEDDRGSENDEIDNDDESPSAEDTEIDNEDL